MWFDLGFGLSHEVSICLCFGFGLSFGLGFNFCFSLDLVFVLVSGLVLFLVFVEVIPWMDEWLARLMAG